MPETQKQRRGDWLCVQAAHSERWFWHALTQAQLARRDDDGTISASAGLKRFRMKRTRMDPKGDVYEASDLNGYFTEDRLRGISGDPHEEFTFTLMTPEEYEELLAPKQDRVLTR